MAAAGALLAGVFLTPFARADVQPVPVAVLSPLSNLGFGSSSDISGALAVAGNSGGRDGINSRGTQLVHVYARDPGSGGWGLSGQIAPDLPASERLGNYGASVAVDGDTVVIGAPVLFGATPGTGYDGRVFIHRRNTGGSSQWGRVKKIDGRIAAGPEKYGFGGQVALSGDTLAVRTAGNRANPSTVRIFMRNQGGAEQWGQVAEIHAPGSAVGGTITVDGDSFADAMVLDGDRLVCGLPDGDTLEATGVYIYERNTGGANAWGLARHIAPGDIPGARALGHRVALEGSRLMVSGVARVGEELATRVWWLTRSGAGAWTVEGGQSVIEPAVGAFGRAVALNGEWAAVAALRAVDADTRRQDVYLYQRSAGNWSLRSGLPGPEEEGAGTFTGVIPAGIPPEFLEIFLTRSFSRALASLPGTPLAMAGDALLHRGSTGAPGGLTVRERTAGGGGGWGSVAMLRPSAGLSESFGETMAADGNWLAVGDPDDDEGLADSGAVWLFERNTVGGDNWYLQAKIKSPTPQAGAHFGAAVALVADGFSYALAVGAPQETVGGVACGRVHSFGRYAGGRSLGPASPSSNQSYGRAVALTWKRTSEGVINGVSLGIGASGHDLAGAANAGMVDVWDASASTSGNWAFIRMLTASDAAANDAFGWSLAMDGLTLAAGALTAGSNGAAYIFERTPGTNIFVQTRKILPGDGDSGLFPNTLALKGNTLAGGTFTLTSGAAFVYERTQGGLNNWGLVKKLRPVAPGGSGDGFGFSVALHGDLILVGASGDDAAASNNGAAWLFQRNRGGANQWNIAARLSNSVGDAARSFGLAVAMANDSLIVGAPNDDDAGADLGAAHVRRAGSYEFWAETHGLNALGAAAADPSADPDADGEANLVEFMLATNPRQSASRRVPAYAFDPATRRLSFSFAKPVYSIAGLKIEAEGRSTSTGSFSFSNCEITENTATTFRAQWRGAPPDGALMRVRATYPSW